MDVATRDRRLQRDYNIIVLDIGGYNGVKRISLRLKTPIDNNNTYVIQDD